MILGAVLHWPIDAEAVTSQPGLGPILGARVLAEPGDAAGRYASARARRNYASLALRIPFVRRTSSIGCRCTLSQICFQLMSVQPLP
jgi:transposase